MSRHSRLKASRGGRRRPADGASAFVKDTGRWAAIPKFRYQLHKALNAKIERIRDEFETYAGNVMNVRGTQGVLTHRACTEEMPQNASVLSLGSVFPLPVRLVSQFAADMKRVRVIEGAYPGIEVQLRMGGIDGRLCKGAPARAEKGERPASGGKLSGLTVIRDRLGPASSINIAHGMAKAGARNILAVTDAGSFLHSGLAAFVNTIYNGSDYLLAIKTNGMEKTVSDALRGFGFERSCGWRRPATSGNTSARHALPCFCTKVIYETAVKVGDRLLGRRRKGRAPRVGGPYRDGYRRGIPRDGFR